MGLIDMIIHKIFGYETSNYKLEKRIAEIRKQNNIFKEDLNNCNKEKNFFG